MAYNQQTGQVERNIINFPDEGTTFKIIGGKIVLVDKDGNPVPIPGQTASSPGTKPPAFASGETMTPKQGAISAGLYYGARGVGEIYGGMQAASANQYASDFTKGNTLGQEYINPQATEKPDLQKYLGTIPSRTQSLISGSPTAGMTQKNQGANIVLNPIGAAIEGMTGEKGINEYVTHVSGKRALEGASAGMIAGGGIGAAIGAIAGGILGIIEGAWGWGQAKDEDARNRQMAIAEFDQALKKWENARQIRLLNSKLTINARQKEEATTKAERRSKTQLSKRQTIMNALYGAGQRNNQASMLGVANA